MVIAEKNQGKFSQYRIFADVFFIILSLMLILIFKLDFSTLREGTWTSMLLLGKSMQYTFPLVKRYSKSLKLK